MNLLALEKHFEKSKIAIEKSNIKNRLKPIIAEAMKQSRSMDDFRQSLLQSDIGCVFRKNEQGRNYGVSFIDYQNQTILNGSRLGKEFSTNVFNDLFKDSLERNIERTVDEIFPNRANRFGQSAESAEVQQSTGGDSLSLGLFEQHGEDYEENQFTHEKKKGRGIGY